MRNEAYLIFGRGREYQWEGIEGDRPEGIGRGRVNNVEVEGEE